jgi:signal transduction histidine kinase
LALANALDFGQDGAVMLEATGSALLKPVASANRRTWHFVVGVFALTAAIVGIGALSFAAFERAVDTERTRIDAVARTTDGFEALLAAERALNTLQEAERSQRGYVLTENPIFLEPYEAAFARGPGLFDELGRRIYGDNERQVERLAVLRQLTRLKLEEMANSVALTRAGQTEEARRDVASGYGRRLMEDIQRVLDEVVAEQRRQLDERRREVIRRDAESAQSIYRLAMLGVALLAAAMIAMVALAYMVYRTRLAVERELASEVERSVLEEAVAERTRELTQANAALRGEIESREQIEARLRQAHRMEAVGQLTGGIAHDFNNMLAVVISSLDLLKRRADPGDAKVARLIENAREGATRAATLTSRLLAFSRRQSLSPEVVDVNRLVTSVVDLLSRTLGDRIRIELALSDDVPLVYIDPAELENAVINLAANARDAMPGGGVLTLSTSCGSRLDTETGDNAPAFAVVSVADTGEGMPPDIVERVFEPFFTTKPVGKGTGLGLSQVHGFLHQSGGRIDIASTPGRGTRVDLFLPGHAATVRASTACADKSEQPIARGNADETILVVEDEYQLRLLTVENLRELGYSVRHADGAAEALAILDSHPGIGLLFTDVMMPGMTGDALAREALEIVPDIGILYTTGYARLDGGDGQIDPPADLLRKPFTMQQLAAKVRETFDRRVTNERVASRATGS